MKLLRKLNIFKRLNILESMAKHVATELHFDSNIGMMADIYVSYDGILSRLNKIETYLRDMEANTNGKATKTNKRTSTKKVRGEIGIRSTSQPTTRKSKN